MDRTSLMDAASFWLAVCGAVAVVGGVPLAIGLAQLAPNAGADPLKNPLFAVGLIVEGLAALALVWGLVLYLAHHHNERERCPDPSAHDRPSPPSDDADPDRNAPGRANVASPEQIAPAVGGPDEPALTAPPVAASGASAVEEVDVTPEYLWSLFEGRTDLQGQRLAEPYIGKWMRIAGPFGDAGRSTPTSVQVTFASGRFPDYKYVYMYFRGEESVERVEVLKVGDPIVVRGRIARVSVMDLKLDDCTLAT